MKKKIFTFFLALVASVGTIFAWDYERVQIDDLYYNLDATTKTALVTFKNSNIDQFNVGWTITTANIPASVTYGGKTYSVTRIGAAAFRACTSLTSVTIPNSVTRIDGAAFYDCTSLTSIVVENGNSVYDSRNDCNAIIETATNTLIVGCQSTIIPNSVTSIGESAFSGCSSLTSVTIPNSVTSIGESAFYGCSSLTSVTIPNSVTSIGMNAFYRCSGLTSVTIGNSVTSIGGSAFSGCSGLTSVTIPNSVTSIGGGAFWDCTSLTSVTIPNSVTSIGGGAFYDCTSLTSVTIPNSVTSIGNDAFDNCSGLTSVTIEAETPPTLGNSVFTSTNNCPIYVPCNAVNTYKKASKWNSYAERIYVNPDCPNITVRLDPSSCSDWSTVRLWAWTDAGNLFNSWPGQVVGKDIDGWYSYTFDEDITSVNIIWNNGTDQTVNINGVTSSTCYALNSTTGTTITASVVNCPNDVPTQYTIVFKNWDGSVLQSTQVEEGQIPQYTGATPTKPSDSQYSYTFSGWTPQIVAATADATYTATYTDTPRGLGVEDVLSDQVQNTKVVRNGQIFILRGEKEYTVTGQEVK